MRHLKWVMVGLLISMLVYAGASGAAAAPVRVAILGDRASEVTDLLTARLSDAREVALVEREQLRAVADERMVAAALGDRAGRERLGGLVAADVLVLVQVPAGEAPGRAVVCDTRLGVTLNDVAMPRGIGREKLVDAVAAEVLGTVRRFAGGVARVVAVTDFVSRDLTFDRAFLQSDYAEVLRAACRELPGTALVSIEEARAIAQERAVSGVGQGDRPGPIFVEGEYRTTRDAATGAVTVALACVARDGQRTLARRAAEPAIPLERAGAALLEFFRADLAPLLAGSARPEAGKAIAGVDAAAQFRLLTERAGQFSELGEFRRAAQLREAALLLRPDADEQRVQLVREYTRRNRQPVEQGQWPKGARQHADDPFWAGVVAQVVSDWNRALQHCEYLIRNRRLSREEATDLTYNAIHSITGVRMVPSPPLAACEAVKKEFLRNVFARVPGLEPADRKKLQGLSGALDAWHFMFESALMRCDGNSFDSDDLDLIADLLLERTAADKMMPSYKLNFFLTDVPQAMGRERTYGFTEAQYLAFLERLVKSDRPLVQVYGRYGKVCYRAWAKRERTPELLAEARDVVAAAGRVGFSPQEHSYFMGQLRDQAFYIGREVEGPKPETAPRRPQQVSSAARATSRPAVTMRIGEPAADAAAKTAEAKSRVRLEPIELTLRSELHGEAKLTGQRWRAAGGWGGIGNYRPMGQGLDVFWASGAVLFMREKGRLEEVLAPPKDEAAAKEMKLSVSDVVTDGPHVFVATAYGNGIYVFDPTGKQLALVGAEQGLPPTGIIGPQLLPVSPGRVLATGSFGNERRGWIAFVDFDDKDPAHAKVDVFHEGAKVWDYRRQDEAQNLDPAMCFEPEWVFEHTTAGASPRRLAFVGRRYNPLVVDLATKKVWAYPRRSWKEGFPRMDPPKEAFLSIDGVLWVAGAAEDFVSYRLDEQTGLLAPVRNRSSWHMGNLRQGSLARDGDWLYFAGSVWRRLNLRTGAEQALVTDRHALPGYGSGNGWQVSRSDLYGLVAFSGGTLYRVTIADGGTP
jgi:hypothetical protein